MFQTKDLLIYFLLRKRSLEGRGVKIEWQRNFKRQLRWHLKQTRKGNICFIDFLNLSKLKKPWFRVVSKGSYYVIFKCSYSLTKERTSWLFYIWKENLDKILKCFRKQRHYKYWYSVQNKHLKDNYALWTEELTDIRTKKKRRKRRRKKNSFGLLKKSSQGSTPFPADKTSQIAVVLITTKETNVQHRSKFYIEISRYTRYIPQFKILHFSQLPNSNTNIFFIPSYFEVNITTNFYFKKFNWKIGQNKIYL